MYAWYYRHGIPRHDVETFSASLLAKTKEERRGAVRQFLLETLFGPFAETAYTAAVKGALKPTYTGRLTHVPSISDSLVDRVAATPDRLLRLSEVLRRCIPAFASPIYIGSATSLRKRLKTHVKLIRRYREGSLERSAREQANTDAEALEASDHNFAFDAICHRGLDPMEMFVAVMEMPDLSRDEVFDIENVLNRITFPLCGRN